MNVLALMCLTILTSLLNELQAAPTERSLVLSPRLPAKKIVHDPIRHGKKRQRNKLSIGRRKKRRKLKNPTSKRFVEKQFLVHNRTIELLGDDVQKILLSTRTLTIKLPYTRDNDTESRSGGEKAGGERVKNLVDSGLLIGLKISQGEASQSTGDEPSQGEEFAYDLDSSSARDEGQHINFGSALSRLIGALSNMSSHSDAATPCEKWLDCKKNLEDIFLGPLPSCPCIYPSEIFYENKIWDESLQRYYRWRDASSDNERLDIYKPGAEYCIRSLLEDGTASLAAQHCCYDRMRRLITRGSGAGNPNLVSPEVSHRLHQKIDLLPWKMCKGDFTRYNKLRPPNNGNGCPENPHSSFYEKQVKLVKFY